MRTDRTAIASRAAILAAGLVLVAACASATRSAPAATVVPTSVSAPATVTVGGSAVPSSVPTTATGATWFDITMTDARTGQSFAIRDYAGKVILVEAMAEWCPTCIEQQRQVKALHDRLAVADDVVSVSLDIDLHEDQQSLKDYAAALGLEWHFAVAPLEVARALGNLYSAEYLNPPYSPMLLIDRNGGATSLPFGVKNSDYLLTALEPYLVP